MVVHYGVTEGTMASQRSIPKPEQYGPRNCPLVRSGHMSDADWEKAKKDFDVLMRRMGKKITWAPKAPHACPQCGTTQGPFGAASGMCFPCSDATVEDIKRELLARAGAKKGGR